MIILLKNESKEDPYSDTFPNAEFVPVLEHKFLDLEGLSKFLECEDVRTSEALIVTSQRAVDALAELHNINLLRSKPVFTVGPATGARLRKYGFTDIRGEDTGNGQTLSDQVLPHETYSKYVFFTGVVHRDIIPKALKNMGASVVEKIVYNTTTRKDCCEKFNRKCEDTNGNDDLWVVFFSPSGVEDIVETLKEKDRSSFKIAAIGPTTDEFLKSHSLIPDCVAEKPTPESLYSAIYNH